MNQDWKNNVKTDISDGDTMMDNNGLDTYMNISYSAINCIDTALKISQKEDVLSVLDLPSGHGRVLRSLVARFPQANVVACDLDRQGVDFCVSKFGVKGVYSEIDIKKLNFQEKFDLIWCGSLLTHLNEKKSIEFLNFFIDKLENDGILVVTFHGRFTFSVFRLFEYINEKKLRQIEKKFTAKGYGYSNYSNMSAYGTSMASLPWIMRYVNNRNDIKLIYMSERFWSDNHDVLAVQKKPIHKINWIKFSMPEKRDLPVNPTSKLRFWIDKINDLKYISDGRSDYSIAGWGFIDKIKSEDSKIYIVLKRNDQYFYYTTQSYERIDIVEFFKNEDYKYSGFKAYISLDTLEKGKYQVGLFIQNASFTAIDFSKKYIRNIN